MINPKTLNIWLVLEATVTVEAKPFNFQEFKPDSDNKRRNNIGNKTRGEAIDKMNKTKLQPTLCYSSVCRLSVVGCWNCIMIHRKMTFR